MAESHSKRKEDHLRICRDEDVAGRGITTGLERYRLRHNALPELALAAVDPSTSLLGHPLRAPFLISAITGGTTRAAKINLHLAQAAEELGLAMCLGSQRAALEDPRLERTYRVRSVAPHLLLFANLGAVQLNYGYGLDECRRAVQMIEADALVLHLNSLQEAIQPHGNTNFSGLLSRIEVVCRGLEVPVIVKEVGWGISGEVARRLQDAGVTAVDVAGAGGTSWTRVESLRAVSTHQRRLAEALAGWGIPTADSLRQCRQAVPDLPLIASGGITTGPQAAVALALGASLVGLARPLLKPAMRSAAAVYQELLVLIDGLRLAMFGCGAGSIAALRQVPLDPNPGDGSLA
ncbi:MAG TPA: type 2 isopentenyl-diphosphate Delta-isomerase [Anaerolineae bacterium]|nr:type 2 isopentenyl-diphosphate Delta-isomerase [Anaerolineae bacterium]